MKFWRNLLCLALLGSSLPASASAPLVVAVSADQVDITSHFSGRDLLVYGAISRPGQVIVLLRSPDSTDAMLQKTQTGPIWLTGAKVTVTGAPGIWQRLSSAPVAQILPAATLQHLGLSPAAIARAAHYTPAPKNPDEWQKAFLNNKIRQHDYVVEDAGVHLKQKRLFSARLQLPASLPLGQYQLDTFLVRQQQVVAQQEQSIEVRQVGFQAWIADFAEQHSWVYGVVLTVLLASLGFGLGIMMRRRSA